MKQYYNKYKGFSILAVLLVIAAVIGVIGIWAVSGNMNTRSTVKLNDELNFLATNLIQDSNAIKATYDQLTIGGIDYKQITFVPGNSSPSNILNPTTGITIPKVNPLVIVKTPLATDGMWIYNPKNFIADNIGDAGPDPTIMIFGVSDPICGKINSILHDFPFILTVPKKFASPSSTVGGATSAYPISNADISTISYNTSMNIIDNSPSSGVGWNSGCVTTATSGTNYLGQNQNVFFRVLKTH